MKKKVSKKKTKKLILTVHRKINGGLETSFGEMTNKEAMRLAVTLIIEAYNV